VVLSWSGGKDSALALHALRQGGAYEVVALLTTVSEEYQRISHHGVRVALLEQQAEAIGVPLHKLMLPSGDAGPCTNEQYEGVMKEAMLGYLERGITHVAFGDLFLEDLRRYREDRLAQVGMKAVFPLWKRDTAALGREFIDAGFEAYLSCIDGRRLDETFVGRRYDRALLRDLPEEVDPCGENGEFHSFVCDGPIFRQRVPVTVSQRVKRDERYFVEMLPEGVEV
ncbi:MAG: diphthine--ammonia ligase, partial [Phycisphaeraceae bacterium]